MSLSKIFEKAAPWLVLLSVLATLWLVAGAVVATNQPQPHAAHHGSADSAKQETPPVAREYTADDRIADYTLILTIFTGALVLATVVLGWATHNLGERADRGMRQLERAYLFFGVRINKGEIAAHPDGLPPDHIAGIFYAQNLGKTPGFIKEFYLRSIPVIPITGEPTYPVSEKYQRVFYNDQAVARDGEQKLARAALDTKEDTLFYGYIKYADIFGRAHFTRFCIILRADALREDPPIIYSDPHGPPAWNEWD